MNKLIVLLLIPVFLLNGIISELGKVPALIAHFNDHRNANTAIDFQEFLSMHYFGDDKNELDNEKDDGLPFKKSDDSLELKFEAVLQALAVQSGSSVFLHNAIIYTSYKKIIKETEAEKLFQPPKNC